MQPEPVKGSGPRKICIWNYQFGSGTERRALRSMKLKFRMKSSSTCEAKGW